MSRAALFARTRSTAASLEENGRDHQIVKEVEIREPQEGAPQHVGHDGVLEHLRQVPDPAALRVLGEPFSKPFQAPQGPGQDAQEDHEAREALLGHHLEVDAVRIVDVGRVGRVTGEQLGGERSEPAAEEPVLGQVVGEVPGVDPPHRRGVGLVVADGEHPVLPLHGDERGQEASQNHHDEEGLDAVAGARHEDGGEAGESDDGAPGIGEEDRENRESHSDTVSPFMPGLCDLSHKVQHEGQDHQLRQRQLVVSLDERPRWSPDPIFAAMENGEDAPLHAVERHRGHAHPDEALEALSIL